MQRRWRVLWLVLAILVSVALIFVLLTVAGSAGSAIAWRTELDRYVRYQETQGRPLPRVLETVRAARPREFSRDLAGSTYGDNPFYVVDHTYSGGPPGPRPLPYPPVEVWCAVLQPQPDTQPAARQVVFVARHLDLYNSAWVVHAGEPAADSPTLLAGLGKMGCALSQLP